MCTHEWCEICGNTNYVGSFHRHHLAGIGDASPIYYLGLYPYREYPYIYNLCAAKMNQKLPENIKYTVI